MVDRMRWLPMPIACAIAMEMIDATVVATAMPSIAADFHVQPLMVSMAVTTYVLSLAVFIPISGWLADRLGSRLVFQAALVIFMVGSIGCAMADTLPQLIFARIVQGFGGATATPVGRLIIVRTVEKAKLVDVMALITLPALIGPMVGPPLAGFIIEHADWRWIFWINIPIGILAFVSGAVVLPAHTRRPVGPFDGLGFLVSGACLSLLLAGLGTAGRPFMPAWGTVMMVAAGLACLSFYIRHARGNPDAVLDLSLLKIPSFSCAVVGGFIAWGGVTSLVVLGPLMLQVGYGFSPQESGLITLAPALGALAAKTVAPQIVRRWGYRPTLLLFPAATALAIMPVGLTRPDIWPVLTVVVLIFTGLFRGVMFTAMQTLTYADVETARMNRATSFASVAQQMSVATGEATGMVLIRLLTALGFSFAGEPSPAAFALVFLVIGAGTATSLLFFRKLPAGVGADQLTEQAKPAPVR